MQHFQRRIGLHFFLHHIGTCENTTTVTVKYDAVHNANHNNIFSKSLNTFDHADSKRQCYHKVNSNIS